MTVPLHRWQETVADVIDKGVAPCTPESQSHAVIAWPAACRQYRNNSRGARKAALTSVYPVCRRVVGDACFDGLARRYVETAPSTCSDLNRYGKGFAAFIAAAADAQAVLAGIAWVADLARLEWLMHRMSYSEDDMPCGDPVAPDQPAMLVPLVSRQLRWMRSGWPVHRVWDAQRASGEPPSVVMQQGDYCLLVQRQGFDVWVREIDHDCWALLDCCARGSTLGELTTEPAFDLAHFETLIRQRWIVGYESRCRDV